MDSVFNVEGERAMPFRLTRVSIALLLFQTLVSEAGARAAAGRMRTVMLAAARRTVGSSTGYFFQVFIADGFLAFVFAHKSFKVVSDFLVFGGSLDQPICHIWIAREVPCNAILICKDLQRT
jgi:hypothetical protein